MGEGQRAQAGPTPLARPRCAGGTCTASGATCSITTATARAPARQPRHKQCQRRAAAGPSAGPGKAPFKKLTHFSQAQTTNKTCLSLRFSKGYRKQKGPKPSTSVQKHSRCSGWNFLLKVGAHEHGSSALPQEPWLRSLHQTNLGCYLVSVLALQLLFNPCATLRASCPLSTACGRHPEGQEQCHW